MKRIKYKVEISVIILSIIMVLCGCSLFVTDEDKFYIDGNLDNSLSRIDIEKAAPSDEELAAAIEELGGDN